jgi:hypothetical protein
MSSPQKHMLRLYSYLYSFRFYIFYPIRLAYDAWTSKCVAKVIDKLFYQ